MHDNHEVLASLNSAREEGGGFVLERERAPWTCRVEAGRHPMDGTRR